VAGGCGVVRPAFAVIRGQLLIEGKESPGVAALAAPPCASGRNARVFRNTLSERREGWALFPDTMAV
jgi:hypothetical protein